MKNRPKRSKLPCPPWCIIQRPALGALGEQPTPKTSASILVVAAGTADIPVAEEAVISAQWLGNTAERLYDVGVAGLHRLFDSLDRLRSASVLIVVAGMEGALPSVIGGLVDRPIIAVPTSIGYGASFGGVAALLAMLNSCAAGVTVVNIDNGFGAARRRHPNQPATRRASRQELSHDFYDLCRIHKTLRGAPAMEAALTDTMPDVSWILNFVDSSGETSPIHRYSESKFIWVLVNPFWSVEQDRRSFARIPYGLGEVPIVEVYCFFPPPILSCSGFQTSYK